MLKHEGFKVGQTIKAFDFQPRKEGRECFVEGQIEDVNPEGDRNYPFGHYRILCSRDVIAGEEIQGIESRVGLTVIVPMETSITEWDGRVEILS